MTTSSRGFTLIELLLVLFVVALLAGIAAPVVTGSLQHAKEAALKEDLHVLRKAIDDHHADTGGYPEDLQSLVDKRYLRRVPPDPLTESRDSWELVREEGQDGVVDVRSGASGEDRTGVPYKAW
jgi:general secretion pathway protein G